MKRIRKLFTLAAAMLWTASCFPAAAAGEARPLRLMIVSDLHYLSPSLYRQSGGTFEQALMNGDGKMCQYSAELLEGLEQEVRSVRPDALLVSGDLSFNGERASHEELASAFGRIESEGTDVWVIPGNHDLNSPYARKYFEGGFIGVPNVSPDEFEQIYGAFMNTEGNGFLSYIVRPCSRLWVALCDVGVYDPIPVAGGFCTPETDRWLQGVLDSAKAAGAQVLTVTHQSLVPHTEFLASSMTIAGGEQMADRMRKAGNASLNLSGHLHIQHISENDGIYDIATGAFSVPPFRYGILTVETDGSLTYEAAALSREHLPQEMAVRAETWFEDIVIQKERPHLESLGIPEEKRKKMLDYASRLNHAYFSGDFLSTDPEWILDPAFEMWAEIRDRDSMAAYLSALPGSPENARPALRLHLP